MLISGAASEAEKVNRPSRRPSGRRTRRSNPLIELRYPEFWLEKLRFVDQKSVRK